MEQVSTQIHKKRTAFCKFLPLYLMALPGAIYLLINNYLPLAGLVVAFKNYDYGKGIFGSAWAGLQNFIFLFRTNTALIMTRNTLLYNAAFIVLNVVFGVTVAILMNEVRRKRTLKIYQTVILLPYLVSMVIVAYLVFAFLSTDGGLINKTVLPALGMEPIIWYNESRFWPVILPIVNTWKSFGFQTIIYYSSVISIDMDLYEAAAIDGAGKLRQIRSITLPLLRPVVIMMVLMAVGRIFYSDFGLFYQIPMNSGVIFSTTQTIDTYVYRTMIQLGDIGMSAAAGLYQSIVGFILVFGSNLLVRRLSPDDALF